MYHFIDPGTSDYITQTLRGTRSTTRDIHDGELQKDRHPERTDKDTPQRLTTSPIQLYPPPRTGTSTAWDQIEVVESSDTIEAGVYRRLKVFKTNDWSKFISICFDSANKFKLIKILKNKCKLDLFVKST